MDKFSFTKQSGLLTQDLSSFFFFFHNADTCVLSELKKVEKGTVLALRPLTLVRFVFFLLPFLVSHDVNKTVLHTVARVVTVLSFGYGELKRERTFQLFK